MKNSLLYVVAFFAAITIYGQKVPAETGSKITRMQAEEALGFHNQARKDVGTNPLIWSTELSAYAQSWADSLVKRGCQLEHRSGADAIKRCGENIYWAGWDTATALDASRSWYSEIKDYKYDVLTSSNWYNTGHYTQMIWKNTTSVGIGAAICPGGATIVVANYDPPGNYMGQKPY